MWMLCRQQPFIAKVATSPCDVDVVHSSNADSLTFFCNLCIALLLHATYSSIPHLFSSLATCILRHASGVAACIHVRLLVFFYMFNYSFFWGGLAACVLRCARASGEPPAASANNSHGWEGQSWMQRARR
jgi:hypothetical protein